MVNLQSLPQELDFLKWINGDRSLQYRTSVYLFSPFESNKWVFKFGKRGSFTIDFNVTLENGSLLTDASNTALLDVFKCWLCIQSHVDITGGQLYSSTVAYANVRRVLGLIDHFLLNSEHFQLSKHGLMYVTENDITSLLVQLSTSNEASNSIYNWPEALSCYLKREIAKQNIPELDVEIKLNDFLALDIPDEEHWMLSLSKVEIVYARAILWRKGVYGFTYKRTNALDCYRYAPNSKKLSEMLYMNTLIGQGLKPLPLELLLIPIATYQRELNSAPVRNTIEDRLSEKQWANYKRSIRSLGQLAEIGAAVPIHAIKATDQVITQQTIELKAIGRYKTLPHNLVLTSLRKAIEFSIEYGPELIQSALSVIESAQRANVSCVTFTTQNDITKFLTPKIKAMGVKVWHLGIHMNMIERHPLIYDSNPRPSASGYFSRLRNNEGLYELIRVLFGAVQICLGALTARRQGELIDLISGDTTDRDGKNLLFYNRKSGFMDMREFEARPIPSIAVKLIRIIEQFHQGLHRVGLSPKHPQLFASPDFHSGLPISLLSSNYNMSIDAFCDYFQVETNQNGERYYIRQHQLRRFFAMMFFWGNSFGGMDTLRWFLGHIDVEHLYHYITESTPGEVLRSAKAQYGCELLKANENSSEELADLVQVHFGTRKFALLDSEELQLFLESELSEGNLEIEPIFIDGPEEKKFKIAIKVNRPG